MDEITQELLNEMFEYRDGDLIRKTGGSGRGNYIGNIAGYISIRGYIKIKIDGKCYLGHRLVFLMHHGYIPLQIDHIDNNPSNNKIDNLREVTNSQNSFNQKKSKFYNGKLTSSKYKGVSWNKAAKKWQAMIKINGKSVGIGYFIYEQEAAQAYNETAIINYGKYAKINEFFEEDDN